MYDFSKRSLVILVKTTNENQPSVRVQEIGDLVRSRWARKLGRSQITESLMRLKEGRLHHSSALSTKQNEFSSAKVPQKYDASANHFTNQVMEVDDFANDPHDHFV